jgi:hypothetical protein
VRRAALVSAKLGALVTARWGPGPRTTESFAPGAALVDPAGGGADDRSTAWLYVARGAARALGGALVWAERKQIDEIHLLTDDEAPLLARRAGHFADPAPTVWQVTREGLIEAEAEPMPGSPGAGPSGVSGLGRANGHGPLSAPDLVDVLARAGVEVVTEAGIVRGEVNGLEVARIIDGETTGGVPLDGPALEVGVGAADRELTAMLHGDTAPVDQLSRAADIVRQHRRPDALRHPLNQLVPERWLRAVLVRRPEAIGLAELHPAEGTRPRPNLRDVDVAVATGVTPEGRSVVVACSVGVDLELVPAAADARAMLDPSAELWLVVPERDQHPVTRRLADRLRSPARLVTVSDDWRRLT